MLLFVGASLALVSALVLTKSLVGSSPWPWTTSTVKTSSPRFFNHTVLFPQIIIYVLLSVSDDDSLTLIQWFFFPSGCYQAEGI